MKPIQLMLVSLILTTSAFAVPVPVGGGAMSAGWHGEYFVSRDLTGAPAFPPETSPSGA